MKGRLVSKSMMAGAVSCLLTMNVATLLARVSSSSVMACCGGETAKAWSHHSLRRLGVEVLLNDMKDLFGLDTRFENLPPEGVEPMGGVKRT